jgi:hypothetical protein
LTVFLTISWCKKWSAESRTNLWRVFFGIFIANYLIVFIAGIVAYNAGPGAGAALINP